MARLPGSETPGGSSGLSSSSSNLPGFLNPKPPFSAADDDGAATAGGDDNGAVNGGGGDGFAAAAAAAAAAASDPPGSNAGVASWTVSGWFCAGSPGSRARVRRRCSRAATDRLRRATSSSNCVCVCMCVCVCVCL